MKRAWVTVGLAVCLLALSCSGGGADGAADASKSSGGERRFLSLGTAPPGGAFFVVGGALGEVLNQFGGEQWEVTAEATQGTMENIRRLEAGDLDFAMANAAITYFAVRGEEGWDKAYSMRSVMTLAPNVALFITPQGSGVTSIEDLKENRVVVGPAGAGATAGQQGVLRPRRSRTAVMRDPPDLPPH